MFESQEKLAKEMQRLLADWTVAKVTRVESDGLPKDEASHVPGYRLVLPTSGLFRTRLSCNERVGTRTFSETEGLFAVPWGWTQEDWTSPHQAVSILFNADHIRYLMYEHSGDGARLPQPQTWYHSRSPLSAEGSSLLFALDQTTRMGSKNSVETAVSLYRSLISLSLDELEKDYPKMEEQTSWLWRDMVRYIEENLNLPISRDTLAAAFQVHPNHVSRTFKQANGGSFSSTLRRLRIERSIRILVTTERPIEDVAALCGFSSANYFIKVFRSVNGGVTPQSYRRNRSIS